MTRAVPLLFALLAVARPAPADDFFEAKIRPVLVTHCFKCHSAASKSPKGGLRVDNRAHLLAGGESGAAVVPKDAGKGTLLEALRYRNTDLLMPPAGKLPDAVVADFEAWVKAGVPWPDEATSAAATVAGGGFDLAARQAAHWCWRPVARPPVPTVADATWPLDPVDRFLLAKLEAAQVPPAAPADPAAWLRRATFALTGLPPTPDDLDAFPAGDSAAARAAAVDRLLASPRYGERWGRHWLDLVRYAESRGHEFDPDIPNAYQYRDYVVRAFNADVPYDRFVREHLAGDTDPTPRRDPATGANESVVGTAFWHLGEEVHSPVDIRQDEADRFDNRIDVLSKAFLGLTVSCARCHDHKFDAISAKDYAALYGVLEGSSYRQARFDTMEQHRDLAKRFAARADEFTKPPPRGPEPAGDFAKLSSGPSTDPAKDVALTAWLAKQKVVVDYAVTAPTADTADGPAFRHAKAGRVTYSPGIGASVFSRTEPRGALVYDRFWDRLKVAPGSAPDGHALSPQPRAGLSVRTPHFTLTAKRVHLLVRGGGLAYAAVGGHTVIVGPLHGALVKAFPDAPAYRWVTLDLGNYLGRRLHVELTATQGTDFAVAVVVPSDETPPAPGPEWSPGWVDGDRAAAWRALEAELAGGVTWSSRLVPALWDADGVDESVFIRGNPRAPGEVVPRRSLEALAGPGRVTTTPGSGRAELAAQLTDGARNPLFDRVIVNRLWHHLFGRGLVPTTDNFGVLGEAPTHPELLDYLATEFAQSGRRVKPFLKRLMLTRAYGMASRPAADGRDPANALLHHFRAKRLEGEAIRDAMLQVSGRLDLAKAGGPSTPIHLTEFLQGRGRPASGPLDGDGRRSLYLATRRNFLSPFLLAYDAPIPFSTVGRRQSSNVPAQALILMNDPFVHAEAARWATRTLATPGTPTERVTRMYREAFARPATAAELQAATEFVAGDDPKAWADLAHALFTVKEFVFVK